MNQRNYKLDNIRFLLIFLVVFGHFLELFTGKQTDLLYRLIYTFHMPVFVFITGFFAKFNPKRILLSLIYPYLLFQTLYTLFHGHFITGADSVSLSYTTPYWLLWYLLATIFYYLLIPLIQGKTPGTKAAVFLGSVAVSLLAGLDQTVGYYLSLSRFFCFLPFFVAGFYCGHARKPVWGSVMNQHKGLIVSLCLLFVLAAECYILGHPKIFTRNVLYGSYSYAAAGYSFFQRALLHAVAFGWIVLLFFCVPGRKLPVISTIGKNTLFIFLFHGFAVRFLWRNPVFQYSQTGNLCLAVAITLMLLLLFGNTFCAWLSRWVFTGQWLEVLLKPRSSQ